jgi:L-fucose isomerase-like protein
MSYKKQLTFGLIVGTRNIFSAQIAQASRSVLLDKMERLGYRYVILPVAETPTGCLETYQDALKCAKLFDEHRHDIDGIVVVLPNFGDEVSIITAISAARLGVPIMVQACDDDNDKVDVHRRRDAFCGKMSVCNNLYQHGLPFTDTTFHTQPLEGEAFERDVHRFAAVCRVVNGLRSARIGAIGARPAGFQTVRASEKLLQASGITVVPVDLSEIIAAASKLGEASEVAAKVRELKAYGRIPAHIQDDKIARQARFSVAVEQWVAAHNVDASAIQCWDSLEKNFGCAACATMSMMGERLVPSACEVDIAGAVAMYALMLAAGTPSALLDWNNNFADDRNKCVCTHCGSYPKSFMQAEPEISTLDVLGTQLGHEDTFGAVKGRVAPGPFSFFRLSTDDTAGCIKAYAGEGQLTADPYGMDGGIAVAQVDNLQQLLKFICRNGFEHHVAMVRGHLADVLHEATASYLGWQVHRHR